MGAALQILNAGATHITAQSQIDIARIKQKSHNDAQITITNAKKLVQTANNAASDSYAASQKMVQTANNSVSAQVVAAQRVLQGTSNDVSSSVVAARRRVQASYNDEADQIAAAQATLQGSRNARSAAESSLSKFGQSIQNQGVMKRAGQEIDRISTGVMADLDRTTTGNAFDRIAFSSSLGANLAAAAGAGLAGGTFENFNDNMSRMQALKEEMNGREARGRQFAAQQAKGQALQSMSANMGGYGVGADLDHSAVLIQHDNAAILDEADNTPIFDNQDYTPIQAAHDYSVYSPDLDYTVYQDHKAMSGFQQIASFIGAGVATYYGGPQAGMAVLDASQAINDMQNGNMAAASQGMNNAFKGAMGGWNTYSAGATSTSSGTAWGQPAVNAIGKVLGIG